MKNSIIITIMFVLVIIGFNGCTATSNYKVNSEMKFEPIPKNERKTYEFFGKEQFIKEVKTDNNNFEGSFEDEFVTLKEDLDPLEGYNRIMTKFNDYVYMNILDPIARGYAKIIPEDGRIAIANFFENITFPIRFVNNILQFKFMNATEETGRFLVNSTVGLLGFFDPASKNLNLEKHNEDFGQTLGYYGVGSGFHIVLPFLGPSNLRDVIGLTADSYVSPLNNFGYDEIKYKIPDNAEKTIGIKTFNTINYTSLNLGKYEDLRKDAIDLYPFLKDIYNQNREKEIKE